MPSDIRSFFGGKPTSSPAEKPAAKAKAPEKTNGSKRGRPRKIVEDDDDDEDEPAAKKPANAKTSPRKQAPPEPALEETTASEYFGKGSKPRRSQVTKPARDSLPTRESPRKTPQRNSAKKATASGKRATAAPSTASKNKAHIDSDEDDFPDDDFEDEADDVFKSSVKTGRRMDDDYEEGSGEEEGPRSKPQKTRQRQKQDDEEFDLDNEVNAKLQDKKKGSAAMKPADKAVEELKQLKTTPRKATKKRASTAIDEDDEDDEDEDFDEEEVKPAKKRTAPSKRATPVKKQKKDEPQDSKEIKAIFDSIPTVRPPSPPPPADDNGEKKKFQFGAHANSAVPAGALSTSELPSGEDNCLAGLSFVFTGQLERLGREQGQNLVKQYGGKVTGAPSKKTSYVVLGQDAGPKKLETIRNYSLKTINEDGLFELIKRLPANGGDGAAAEKYAEKMAKEEESIRKAAAEMEEQEKARLAAVAAKSKAASSETKQSVQAQTNGTSKGKASEGGQDSRLWTVRYAPVTLTQICGNKSQVDKLQRWLRMFPKSQRTKFKMPGPDGSGVHRAVMIHGPPGIGKTTAAHLVAKLEGYDIVESNASDTRSKKLVETGLKGVLSTTSLMGYFSHGSDNIDASKKKLVLIMDEVDGMSAGDRGGVGALAAVCKKTQVPMILICNDRKLPKMKPFDFVTFDLPFRRPTTEQIRSRISTIAFREGLKMPSNVINALIEGSGADIRQVVNMISTAKLDNQDLSYEDGKDMSKAWEKHIILKPWDMVGKILGGGLFNPAAGSTLNDKGELYFNDHEFAPLMLQENYLGTNPVRANKFNGPNPKRRNLAALDLVSKAADSISDGDLVDRMIHGSQQQWSLMPAHAMFSFVRPASFVYGSMAGHQTRFTAWLGKNSNQGKLTRFVKEIQGHMRLRVSADRHEIRQTYMPLLFDRLIRKLQAEGKDAVPEIIDLMDSYYLTKEDWDAILELGVGKDDMENIKIDTQAKSTFTRVYNKQSHPLPFIKASQVVAPKRAPAKEKPDLEEALEESDDEAALDDEPDSKDQGDDDDEVDLSKDKYVKVAKKKPTATAKKTKSKKSAAGKGEDDDDEEMDVDEEEDVKPKKGKGKGKAKK